jgi:hypothetical protein
VEAGDLCDAAFDGVADLDEDGAVKGKKYIDPAAEFYKSKFFTSTEQCSGLCVAHYFTGNFAGNLSEENEVLFLPDDYSIPFIQL